jgi:hypothetical protein
MCRLADASTSSVWQGACASDRDNLEAVCHCTREARAMTSPDAQPPFPHHRRYYLLLKIAVIVAAVILALAYLFRTA